MISLWCLLADKREWCWLLIKVLEGNKIAEEAKDIGILNPTENDKAKKYLDIASIANNEINGENENH